jgi:hypothetical protein
MHIAKASSAQNAEVTFPKHGNTMCSRFISLPRLHSRHGAKRNDLAE